MIRPARETDFSAIAALTTHYINTSAIHFGYEPVTAEELLAQWQKAGRRYPWLIAEQDGRFAGYAKAGVWRDRAAYQWAVETGIYIEPAAQGRGVGRALYTALLDDLRRRGFHMAIGGITLPNEPSERLHEALGFEKVAHFKHAGWKFDRWHDVGFWQLLLNGPEHQAGPLT